MGAFIKEHYMSKGRFGFNTVDDLFDLDSGYMGFGGYADPAMSLVSAPALGTKSASPVSFFGYSFPVVEQRHHYDVSYYSGNYYQNGQYQSGDYSFSNFSIDTIDQYSWFGHTSMYQISSSSGYGSWFSAPGYNVSSGHYQSSEVVGVHSDSWFGSSYSFAFRDTSSDFLHIQSGAFVIDNSHLEIHEGDGVHVNSVLGSMDNFAFRDTVIDTSHVQFGNYSSDTYHSVVQQGSSTHYGDIFGNYGVSQEASLSVHDQWSQSGPNSFESHQSDYTMHTADSLTIGMPPFMMAVVPDDHFMLKG